MVDSPEAVTKYRKDSTIPLVDVVNSFEVFVTNKHGAQGVMDRASKSQLENEFNTSAPPPLHMLFLRTVWEMFC
jgi:ribosome maturation protein Sdo1